MKRILVFRHGKSDWHAEYGSDHDRPLARRGRAAARTMGHFLTRIDSLPDLVVTSTAVRAAETVRLAAQAGGWPCPIEATDQLYGASVESVLRLVHTLPEEHGTVLLAGHQPTCSAVVGRLIGGGELKFPTAAMARLDFAADSWRQVVPAGGMLAWLVTPKLLQKVGLQDK